MRACVCVATPRVRIFRPEESSCVDGVPYKYAMGKNKNASLVMRLRSLKSAFSFSRSIRVYM